MSAWPPPDLAVTGIGITSAIGQGQPAFSAALLAGRSRFDVMRRPGRQWRLDEQTSSAFLGAEIEALQLPVGAERLRTVSFSGRVALATLAEAWRDARLDEIDPARVGLIIGGSNVQQRDLVRTQMELGQRVLFVRPSYGLSFLDSDLCGVCTEHFGIGAFAHMVGGASASGQLAVIEAAEAVRSGRVDACVALGALQDLSCWECQGLRSMGAMGSDRYADSPSLACRPYDRDRDGFIYGEACGAVVVERLAQARRDPYARIAGWAVGMDRNRNPNPSRDGEVRAIAAALQAAALEPRAIDYVNPHGSGSRLGDETELAALEQSGLREAYLNATKSITGHGLAAAGAVEIIATVLQMITGRLHPSLNLQDPVDPSFHWVRQATSHRISNALNLSFGFGGLNTALCLQRL